MTLSDHARTEDGSGWPGRRRSVYLGRTAFIAVQLSSLHLNAKVSKYPRVPPKDNRKCKTPDRIQIMRRTVLAAHVAAVARCAGAGAGAGTALARRPSGGSSRARSVGRARVPCAHLRRVGGHGACCPCRPLAGWPRREPFRRGSIASKSPASQHMRFISLTPQNAIATPPTSIGVVAYRSLLLLP